MGMIRTMNRDELAKYINHIRNEEITDIDGMLRMITENRLTPNHVEDEEKSVRWNREYAEKLNDDLDKQEVELKKQRSDLINSIYNTLYDYLVEYGEGTITRNDAIRILMTLPKDDYYFNDGAVNTICDCEDIVDLFIEHNKELEEDGK